MSARGVLAGTNHDGYLYLTSQIEDLEQGIDMNVTLWVVAWLLAAAFLATGALKVTRSKAQLAAAGMSWVEDFSQLAIRAIGVAEILGAIGLVLPRLVDVAPVLTPIAATGLAINMVGALILHLRRKETSLAAVNIVLFALSVFVAVGRF